MDEILYELREHAAGLNCGRWDYIFSFIKKFRDRPEFVLPDRAQVTMTTPFMRAYAQLLVKTCHRRGAHAMGGMAAQIPIKNDPRANEQALAKVREDKLREAGDGHDGTWVAHPGLVPVAREIFDRTWRPAPTSSTAARGRRRSSASDLLDASPDGRASPRTGCATTSASASSTSRPGCAAPAASPIYNLMEDAATAEISRAQVWQWIHHGAPLDDGRR